jgi:hypothetical protein
MKPRCRRQIECRKRGPLNAGAGYDGLLAGRRRSSVIDGVKTLRQPIRPLRRDLDQFLFASVGEEVDGVPLSVVSALVRLGLDPWEEASRLSALGGQEAAEQLARLIAELPGRSCSLGEARQMARPLVILLPSHEIARRVAPQIQVRPHYQRLAASLPSPAWIICAVLAAAVVFTAIAQHGFHFGPGTL